MSFIFRLEWLARACAFVLAGLSCTMASATSPTSSLADAVALIEREQVELEPGWLALLHYHHKLARAAWQSHADAQAFFLSADGKTNPRAELIASVSALLFDADAIALRCRFPARLQWLRERFSITTDEDDVLKQCPALQQWYEHLQADSVSIDFASSYLENPSSLFGHTFLHFGVAGTPALLTPSVNYAADSSRENGKLAFIFKGLFGGFPGVADQLPYFRRLRAYGDNEGRAIWEYPLTLTPAQIRTLLLHLWEVKDGVFDYYFLDENCSYRTLALINVARPDLDLLDRFKGDVVPVETIRALRDKGLIDQPLYWPSSTHSLSWHTRDFSSADLQLVVDIAQGRRQPDALAQRPIAARVQILAAAFDYFAIRVNRNQIDSDTRSRVMAALVQERLRLDQPLPPDPIPVPPSPLETHGGRAVTLGWVDRQGAQGVELGYAGFQHTLTDPLAGYDAGAEVTVLGGRFRFSEGGGHGVERFDVLRVQSETPSTRLFQQAAWTLQFGAERKYVDAARPLLGTLGYASGRAINTPAGVLALTLGAGIDGGPDLRSGVGFEGKARLELTRQWLGLSYQAYIEYAKYLLGEDSGRQVYGLRVGVPILRNLAIGLDLQRAGARNDETQAVIELRQFF